MSDSDFNEEKISVLVSATGESTKEPVLTPQEAKQERERMRQAAKEYSRKRALLKDYLD